MTALRNLWPLVVFEIVPVVSQIAKFVNTFMLLSRQFPLTFSLICYKIETEGGF